MKRNERNEMKRNERWFFCRPNGPTEHVFEGFFAVRMALPNTFLKVFLPSEWPYRTHFYNLFLHMGVRFRAGQIESGTKAELGFGSFWEGFWGYFLEDFLHLC